VTPKTPAGFTPVPGGTFVGIGQPPASIGKYQIVERVGSGGFASVFKAWDPDIKRFVAVKACTVGPEMHARFFQEAELAGRLQHPNITTVFDSGLDGDRPFIVQEFLPGEDLSHMIARREPMELDEKIRLLMGVSLGLEYAHRAGVVHRDVKPANVRVLENGAVKIMDFGIAKAMGAQTNLTGQGIAVGSMGYMSPEQISGDPIDARSDVFSFGVLAYELFSFQQPFRNEHLFRLLEMIVKEDAHPLTDLVPDLPPGIAAVVDRAMHKRPDDRYASMTDLRRDLNEAHQAASLAPAPSAGGSRWDAELRRHKALERYRILDTPSEPEFDELAALAARTCGVPWAWIALADGEREWLKSSIGVPVQELPLEGGFTAATVAGEDVLVVRDAREDSRFLAHPLVSGDPHIAFYAGAPLRTPEGVAIGTLAVLDREPHEPTDEQLGALRVVARQVIAQMELRRLRVSDRQASGERLLLEAAGLAEREDSHG
jgi:eukaryotic-like serine/threonine-protein kinase